MAHSDELDVLARDTVEMLADSVQGILYLASTSSFNVATMKPTTTIATGINVDCVRMATRTNESIINGKPTKIKETQWIIKAADVTARAPAENDRFELSGVTRTIIHCDVEVAGRQYRVTTRELG